MSVTKDKTSAIKEKIYVSAESPFVLTATDRLWMILAGEVNVFYTKIDEQENYTNRLKHLYTAKKGEVLFSLLTPEITDDTRLIVFSNEATLLAIDKADLLDVDHFFLKNMIDKWILKTSSVVNTASAPRVYKPLDDYQVSILDANTVAFPSNGINWIQLLKGGVSLDANPVLTHQLAFQRCSFAAVRDQLGHFELPLRHNGFGIFDLLIKVRLLNSGNHGSLGHFVANSDL